MKFFKNITWQSALTQLFFLPLYLIVVGIFIGVGSMIYQDAVAAFAKSAKDGWIFVGSGFLSVWLALIILIAMARSS